MGEKKKNNQEIIDSYDYLGNACSNREMTGLIPANPPDASGRNAYEEIFRFQPGEADADKQ